jgi:hypothetical protein
VKYVLRIAISSDLSSRTTFIKIMLPDEVLCIETPGNVGFGELKATGNTVGDPSKNKDMLISRYRPYIVYQLSTQDLLCYL